MTTVFNLSNDDLAIYLLEPEEALISAAIEHDRRAFNLVDPAVRAQYRARIERGDKSAAIGDLAVLTQ